MQKRKNCISGQTAKNGKARGKQRCKRKECRLNFVGGGARAKEKTADKKAALALLYSLGKSSLSMLVRLFGSWPSKVCRSQSRRPKARSRESSPTRCGLHRVKKQALGRQSPWPQRAANRGLDVRQS